MRTLRDLVSSSSRPGIVTDIVLRPARGAPAIRVDAAEAIVGRGLDGDRRAAVAAPTSRRRELTLLQAEHLPMVARWVGRDGIDATLVRRNLVIAGINLLAMRSPFGDQVLHWRIGRDVIVDITGPCEPCSRMEEILGVGGYAAMRGHGGVTACLVAGGTIRVGDAVTRVVDAA